MIIAIDGPAGSGKSTTARLLARRLNYLYLDTGAMYRAIALAFLQSGVAFTEEAARTFLPQVALDVRPGSEGMQVFLHGRDITGEIRSREAGEAASRISVLGPVRERLVREQQRIGRAYAAEGGGVVIDGRDIGTVVFPDADLKIYLLADPRERAYRRQSELAAKGQQVSFDVVLGEIRERDRRDMTRQTGPLRKADDAIELDTTSMGIDEQVRFVFEKARERQGNCTV